VAFEAWQDGEKIFHYPAVPSPAARVVQVFREAFGLSDLEEKDLAKLEAESSPLKMRGWVLSSRLFIPSSRGILTFVNGRSVKDKLLQHAILAAAKEVLFGKLYPQLVLHLDAPPDWVDVNVHPAKSEVRFKEPGHVFGFVRKHLEKLLADDRRGSIALSPLDAPISQAETLADLLLPLPETAVHYHQKGVQDISPIPDLIPGALHSAPPAPVLSPAMGGPQFLGTLRNTYLVCQDSDGLLLVDQHAAHERVTYERLKNTRLLGSGSQPLLISLQVELPRQTLDRIEADFPRLANFGLVCERTGPTLVAIREMPSLLFKRDGNPALPAGELLRKIVNDWDENAGEGMEARLREILLHELATMSCHGSVRAGQSLSAVEAEALLKQMSATDFSGHCPHGRPTTVRFSWSELERLFKRLV
jgi:DNA mismatch repair protein MutL